MTVAPATTEKICIIDATGIYIFNTLAPLLTFQANAPLVHKAERLRPPAERHSAACLPPPQTRMTPCIASRLIALEHSFQSRPLYCGMCVCVCVSGSQLDTMKPSDRSNSELTCWSFITVHAWTITHSNFIVDVGCCYY